MTHDPDAPPPYDVVQEAIAEALRAGIIEIVGVDELGEPVYCATGVTR